MSEIISDEAFIEEPPYTDAHIVRWHMHKINDAYESGSGEDVNKLIQEMHISCDERVIRRVEKEKQLARQALRSDLA